MGQKVVYEKDLNLFAEELAKRYGMSQNGGLIPLKDMIFTDQNQYVGVKFIIMYMSGSKINEEGKIKLNGAEFYLLVK
jgi:hypothetical protein